MKTRHVFFKTSEVLSLYLQDKLDTMRHSVTKGEYNTGFNHSQAC